MASITVSRILRILSSLFLIGCGHPLATFPLQYTPGTTYQYQYSTDTLLNEPGVSATTPARKDVGFRFSGDVSVTPIWNSNGIVVFKVEVSEPKLQSISRAELSRALPSLSRFPIYFQWETGRVSRVFVADDDTTLSSNLKKGIVSIFQLKLDNGIHSEVDVSGECQVTYEKLTDSRMRKLKKSCSSLYTAGKFRQVNELLGVNVTSQSQTDYVISNDVISSAVTAESAVVLVNLEQQLAASAYIRQELTYKDTKKSAVVQAPSVDALLKKIAKSSKSGFYGTTLETTFEPRQCSGSSCTTIAELVSTSRQSLDVRSTGKLDAAVAFNSLVRAFRSASKENIVAALKDKENRDIFLALIDVAVATQTTAAQSALMETLNFNDEHSIDSTERYLLDTALSTHPSEQVLTDLLKLFKQNVPNDKLRESIGEALGAVVNTYRRMPGHDQHKIIGEVETALLEKLSGCSGATVVECQLTSIRALSNARLPATLSTLVKLATTAKDSSLSEAALIAVSRMDSRLIQNSEEVGKALRDIFYQRYRGYDSAVRTQALKMLLLSPLTQDDINDISRQTLDPWNTDYSLYILARLTDATQRNQTLRPMVRQFYSGINGSNYHILAPKGKSLAFTSLFAETADLQSTYHLYVENGRSGIMKRSGMDVDILSSVQNLPVYSFKLYAAGLEALLGDEVDESEKDIDVTAGLALDLVGVSLRPITFFVGQGGLMSAIWSAPAELTPALQTNFLLQDHSERLHLSNGLIAEIDVLGALSLGLEGSLSVSLWNKNAQSLIKNSAALRLSGSFSILTPSFSVGVEFNASTQSFIDFRSDVNFYDGVVMCLQMGRPAFDYRTEVVKTERCRGFRTSYRTKITRTRKINAASYPLPGRNAENCRKLASAT